MIYFCADLHFNHTNILEYENRTFDNIIEHDKCLIDNWNNTVARGDRVYILGDFSFYKHPCKYLQSLHGEKHLIMGNHDYRHKRLNQYFASVNDVKMLKHDGHLLFLSHYAHRVWPQKNYGAYHLYGHSHGN